MAEDRLEAGAGVSVGIVCGAAVSLALLLAGLAFPAIRRCVTTQVTDLLL